MNNDNNYIIPNEMIDLYQKLSYEFLKDIKNIMDIKYNLELYFRSDYYGNSLYGEFMYPNKIHLYLTKIIMDSMYVSVKYNIVKKEFINILYTSILEVLLHEVCHHNQKIDMLKYHKDLNYNEEIEDINEIYSVMIMINNKDYFENEYEFKYNFSLFNINGYNLYLSTQGNDYYNNIKQDMENKYYFMNDYKTIYLYNLISFLPDINMNELSGYMDNHESIKILFRDGQKNLLASLLIKNSGSYLNPEQFLLNMSKYINMYFYNFYLSYDISVNDNILVIDITRMESIVNIWDK